MPAFADRYRQVMDTYVHRRAFVGLLVPSFVLWAGWLAWKVYFARTPRYWSTSFTDAVLTIDPIFFLLPFIVLFGYTALLVSHVRQQLNDPRAFLVPNFRTPHLVVASAAFLLAPLVGVAITLITERTLGLRGESYALGLLAIALTVLMPVAWWASFRTPWLSLLVIPLLLLAAVWTPVGHYFADLASGRSPYSSIMAIQLIGIDLAALYLLFIRLRRLNPDAAMKPMALEPAPQGPVAFAPARHEPIFTTLARAWHRKRGILDPRAPWAVAGLLTLILVLFTWIHGATSDDLLRSVLLPALVPGVVVSAVWRERWLNVQFESLYPASRREFVGELLSATALSLAELWITVTLAILVPILIWSTRLHDHIPILLVEMAASALMQCFVFGVMLVASLFRGAVVLANFITILALIIPMTGAMDQRLPLSPRNLIAVAMIEMLIGLALTIAGLRAWRRIDLA